MKLKQRKTNQTKSWVIIKNDKIDKPLERLTKKKREKAQITNTRNGKKGTSLQTLQISKG